MSPFRNRNLLSLALAHFTVDFYSGVIPILLAVQAAPLGLTPGQIGLIALAYRVASSVVQPLFGMLADGGWASLITLGGVLWQATFVALAGLASRFEVLLMLTTIGGLGSAAFHPPGAAGVPRFSTSEQRGGAMSVFLLGGTSGYAFGPLAAGFILDAYGPRGTLLLTALAAVVMPILYAALRRMRRAAPDASPASRSPTQAPSPAEAVGESAALAVGLLITLIAFRSWAAESMSTYLPQILVQGGEGVVFAGNISFLMALGAAAGSLAAGFLSDRVGRHRVIIATLLGAAPMLAGVVRSQGALLGVFAFGLGFCIQASLPLTLLLGQELTPGRTGMMSGLTLGFTFVAGGIGAAITGALAESAGLLAVLAWFPVLPLVSAAAAAVLFAVDRARRRAEAEVSHV